MKNLSLKCRKTYIHEAFARAMRNETSISAEWEEKKSPQEKEPDWCLCVYFASGFSQCFSTTASGGLWNDPPPRHQRTHNLKAVKLLTRHANKKTHLDWCHYGFLLQNLSWRLEGILSRDPDIHSLNRSQAFSWFPVFFLHYDSLHSGIQNSTLHMLLLTGYNLR